MNFIVFLFVGLIAGWLASIIIKGKGFGLIINLLLGVLGAFIGGSAFDLLGIQMTGFFGMLISATIGAIILIWFVGLFRR